MEAVSKPVHCNTNAEIVDAFRHGDWHRIERLSNPMLDDHWDDRRTYYYVADGSKRNRYILVNIDIDCHASGSERGAAEAAEYLKANFFPDLYHEPSTNGQGRHGYFILDKSDLGAEPVKTTPERPGTPPERPPARPGLRHRAVRDQGPAAGHHMGRRRRISNYTAGILAKIPRQVHRFEEWKRTTVLDQFRLRRLITTLRSLTPEVAPTEEVGRPGRVRSRRGRRSRGRSAGG